MRFVQVHAATFPVFSLQTRAKNTFLESVDLDDSEDHARCNLRRCLSDSVLIDASVAHVLQAYLTDIDSDGEDGTFYDAHSTEAPDDEDSDQLFDDEASE
mmetsp:Transcript_115230/g.229560  ORF Transcript_115230/g.229560 Transcript_115230/m.229560 type:complete len:100 (+) Transcript_115230:37-336(+)